jgi:hypothetical protein
VSNDQQDAAFPIESVGCLKDTGFRVQRDPAKHPQQSPACAAPQREQHIIRNEQRDNSQRYPDTRVEPPLRARSTRDEECERSGQRQTNAFGKHDPEQDGITVLHHSIPFSAVYGTTL